jgi:glutaminyl-peptide cyclotransferase
MGWKLSSCDVASTKIKKMRRSKNHSILLYVAVVFVILAVVGYFIWPSNSLEDHSDDSAVTTVQMVGSKFCADSAFRYCEIQCAFGPRTMNSSAHDQCADYIETEFKQFGCIVIRQNADLKGYDGTILKSTNIIASYRPELTTRILICAHWDSRPWADNDPDSTKWHQPVTAANDGASGVAVMMEIARQISKYKKLNIGVDFICLDAEDWGTPQWASSKDDPSTWALGAQYWSKNPHKDKYEARFGILLDMVGGEGAKFYREGVSKQYAPGVVDKVWAAAKVVGAGSYFPDVDGGQIIDDHGPINENAHIPTIDIIPYYTDCQASSFGPTWHTVSDDMSHIDRNTLNAVGQTLIQVIYSEK